MSKSTYTKKNEQWFVELHIFTGTFGEVYSHIYGRDKEPAQRAFNRAVQIAPDNPYIYEVRLWGPGPTLVSKYENPKGQY